MKVETVINITGGIIINNPTKFSKIKNIQTDTRKLNKGDLFIAVKGCHHDGHEFVHEAINKEVSAVIVEKDINIDVSIPIIKVSSTLKAIGQIASYKRDEYNIPLIAITGSTGKTTTKDLISDILSTKYIVLKNEGNHNNHLGLPETLFKLNSTHQVIVTELGMNHFGEIAYLSNICKPNYAVITNIGTAHIGYLGSKKNIFKAKLEILEGMNNGCLLVNGDDELLRKIRVPNNIKLIKEGIKDNSLNIANVFYDTTKTTFNLMIDGIDYPFVFNVPGKHLLIDVILAIKIGLIFGVEIENIINTVANYQPIVGRMNIVESDKCTVIDDSYNSSYEALIGSLELLKKINKPKIIILGDILELGRYSKKIHKKINKQLSDIYNKQVLLIGEHVRYIEGEHFVNTEELVCYLNDIDYSGSVILIKGSARMNLKHLKDYIIERKD